MDGFDHFPTNFAMKIAYKCNLVAAPTTTELIQLEKEMRAPESGFALKDIELMLLEYGFLKEFQELSIANSFENSLVSYHGRDLTDEEKTALLLIYSNTCGYIAGFVINNLLKKLPDAETRDMTELAGTILQIVGNEDIDDETKKKVGELGRRIVVNTGNVTKLRS